MTMTEWFLAELESEAAKSRRVLEQVPTGKWLFRTTHAPPRPESRP